MCGKQVSKSSRRPRATVGSEASRHTHEAENEFTTEEVDQVRDYTEVALPTSQKVVNNRGHHTAAQRVITRTSTADPRINGRCLTCVQYGRSCSGYIEVLDGCRICRQPNDSKGEKLRVCLWEDPGRGIHTYQQAREDRLAEKQKMKPTGGLPRTAGQRKARRNAARQNASKQSTSATSSTTATPPMEDLSLSSAQQGSRQNKNKNQSLKVALKVPQGLDPLPNTPVQENPKPYKKNIMRSDAAAALNEVRANIRHLPNPTAAKKAYKFKKTDLDTSGKPCEKWIRRPAAITSFTGYTFEIPGWRREDHISDDEDESSETDIEMDE